MRLLLTQFVLLNLSLFGSKHFSGFELDSGLSFLRSYVALVSIWFFALWLTHKHNPKFYQVKIKYVMAPFFTAGVFFIATSCFLSLIIRNNVKNVMFVFYTTLFYTAIEILFFSIFTYFKVRQDNIKCASNDDLNNLEKYEQSALNFNPDRLNRVDLTKISQKSLVFPKEILRSLYENRHTGESPTDGLSLVINDIYLKWETTRLYDLLILNVPLNNVRRINKTLKNLYHMISDGGYIVFAYKDIEILESDIQAQSPKMIVPVRMMAYYIFKRACPKIPFLNKFYFAVTKGKNRVLSKAEVWGRYSYCGFDVLKEIQENGMSYAITQKRKTISDNPNPSYYPLIRLNRVSLRGRIVKIHKIRSMYPFSEFIQKNVFEMSGLTTTGKFFNDFRITKIGKIYRKYWIDELPQLLDWFRGEIKLVGIRAMSQHYFSLYSEEYRQLYFQVKPGLLSPIFDEELDSFEMIQKIEQEYLEKYLKHPLLTDIKYFWLTLINIFKGIRSS